MGFDFGGAEQVELADYNKDLFSTALEALQLHIMSLGGQVESGEKFDPYKPSLSSTPGIAPRVPVQKEGPIDVYDPAAVKGEIDKLI